MNVRAHVIDIDQLVLYGGGGGRRMPSVENLALQLQGTFAAMPELAAMRSSASTASLVAAITAQVSQALVATGPESAGGSDVS